MTKTHLNHWAQAWATGWHHLTLISTNSKLGGIPAHTASRNTCPDVCPLKDGPCYANLGPMSHHWDAVTQATRGMSWEMFCEAIETLHPSQAWRYGQAGDLPGDGVEINGRALTRLIRANNGRPAIVFTHYCMDNPNNRQAVAWANANGLTINLSANSPAHADALADLGIGPVVTILDKESPAKGLRTPQGRRIVVCPAQTRADTTCATCGLCARQRDTVVGFIAHGTQAKKAGDISKAWKVIPIALAA